MEEIAFRVAARRMLLSRNARFARIDLVFKIVIALLGVVGVTGTILVRCTRPGPITLPPETLIFALWIGGPAWIGLFAGHWWWRRTIDRHVRTTFSNADFEVIAREVAAKFGRHT